VALQNTEKKKKKGKKKGTLLLFNKDISVQNIPPIGTFQYKIFRQ
jgi:hypothetical protein